MSGFLPSTASQGVALVAGNTYWTQADWYVDPVSGSDSNTGIIGNPVQTIMGGVVAKWGTTSPTLKVLPQSE